MMESQFMQLFAYTVTAVATIGGVLAGASTFFLRVFVQPYFRRLESLEEKLNLIVERLVVVESWLERRGHEK